MRGPVPSFRENRSFEQRLISTIWRKVGCGELKSCRRISCVTPLNFWIAFCWASAILSAEHPEAPMPQESWQQGRTDQEAVLTEDSLSRELPVWPMVAGVVAAAFALEFVCPWLLHPGTLPRFGLLVVAVLLLFTAVMVCGFVVRTIYLPDRSPRSEGHHAGGAGCLPDSAVDSRMGALRRDVVAADASRWMPVPGKPWNPHEAMHGRYHCTGIRQPRITHRGCPSSSSRGPFAG